MMTRQWDESDEAKSSYVKELFSALAKRYNVMTDVWTLGLHRLWKRQAMKLCALQPGERVLDVATGTGDLAFAEQAAVGPEGQVGPSTPARRCLRSPGGGSRAGPSTSRKAMLWTCGSRFVVRRSHDRLRTAQRCRPWPGAARVPARCAAGRPVDDARFQHAKLEGAERRSRPALLLKWDDL